MANATPGSTAEFEAARLTGWVLILSVLQMLTGLFGIYLIARTLRANEQAVTVANRALTVQQKASVDESRAYVHAAAARIENRAGPPPAYVVHLDFVNSGQTPATHFEFAVEASEVKRGMGRSVPFPAFTTFKRWSPIGAGDRVTAAWRDYQFSEKLRERYIPPKRATPPVFLLMGAVRYRTIYGELFETQFAYYLRELPHHPGDKEALGRSTNPARAYHLVADKVPALSLTDEETTWSDDDIDG